MLWIRNFQYDGKKIGDKKLIHGHTPTPFENLRDNLSNPSAKVINIDSGCVNKSSKGLGILTAIDIDNQMLIYQKNIDQFR